MKNGDTIGMSHEVLMDEELIRRQTPEAQAIIRLLLAKIAELEARIETLSVGKNPRNSSLPPSSEHPHANPAVKEKPSGQKRGGQPGHAKHERPLIPTEQCHDVISLQPEECRRCGRRLSGCDPEPLRHQVWELPEIQPIITEYQRQRLKCTRCGITTCAPLPDGAPEGQSGPRLISFVALLMAHFRQSKRRVSLFCETVLNTPMSPGLVIKLQAGSLHQTHDDAGASGFLALYVDTGWRGAPHRLTTKVTQRRPRTFDFKTRPIRRSG